MSSSLRPSLPLKTNPSPNFFADYSVVLPASLKEAYAILGTSAGHERVCRLSKLCSGFELFEKDQVELPVPSYPDGKTLNEVGVRLASASAKVEENGDQGEVKTGSIVTRQHFKMEETIPVLFGMFKTTVLLTGTLSWDDAALPSLSSASETIPSPESEAPLSKEDVTLHALYESISDSGIMVWKLRTFTPHKGDPTKTKITENIEGWAPTLLRSLVQSETLKAHKAHMELYHNLFE